MEWLIILHLLTEAGYGGTAPEIYPRSFPTKAACEAYLKTKTFHSYVRRHHFKFDRDFLYGECTNVQHRT